MNEGHEIREIDITIVLGAILGSENTVDARLPKCRNTKRIRLAKVEVLEKRPSRVRREPPFPKDHYPPRLDSNFVACSFSLGTHDASPPPAHFPHASYWDGRTPRRNSTGPRITARCKGYRPNF